MQLLWFVLFLSLATAESHARYGSKMRKTGQLNRPKSSSQPKGGRTFEDYLLPTSITPLEYDIKIIPYLDTSPNQQFEFEGCVIARLLVQKNTSTIIMHARNLEIFNMELWQVSTNTSVTIADWNIANDDRNFFTIIVNDTLVADNEYQLKIMYTGSIGDDASGFYRYAYNDSETDTERTGLANWVWVDFSETPLISPYIFCFAVHQFACLQNAEDSRISILARPSLLNYMHYALEVSPRILRFYEDYTEIPFMLPKLDQVALKEFAWDGMENWGIITYSEAVLTFDPNSSNTYEKQDTATTIAHEFAHQWFGDLVSPQCWRNTWLSEGFATFFEHRGAAVIGPDWQLDEQFITEYVQPALETDADVNTHPLYANVNNPDSSDKIFDRISYAKGGSIIRFMENFMGEDKFKAALRSYLSTKRYGVANESELFDIMSPFAPKIPKRISFRAMMESWTKQAGYPLVTLMRHYDNLTATITQERFNSSGSEKWIIPLTMTNGNMSDFGLFAAQAWLLNNSKDLVIESPLVPDKKYWMLLNIRQTGFYRVNYDERNWLLLSDAQPHEIAPENRAQLVDDAMALARSGRLCYYIALYTTSNLHQETSLVVWRTVTYVLSYIKNRLYQSDEGIQLFQNYMIHKLRPVYRSVNGFNVSHLDAHVTSITRSIATQWLCDMHCEVCNKAAKLLFAQWQQSNDPDDVNMIVPDIRQQVYCAGIRNGGEKEFQFLLLRWNSTTNEDERLRMIHAWGCSRDINFLKQLLNITLKTRLEEPREALNMFIAVTNNPLGVDIAFDFLIDHWMTLEMMYGDVGDRFCEISNKLNTQEQYNKIVDFRNEYEADLNAKTLQIIDRVLSKLRKILAWNFANLQIVMNYFRDMNPPQQ